jgi:hypothetical protein
MSEILITNKKERGSTIIEFVVVALMLFVMVIGIAAGGNLYYTHNALVETTRRGARFAAMQAATNPIGTPYTTPSGTVCDNSGPSVTDIKNFAMYGNVAGTGPKLAPGLTAASICIVYGSLPSDPAGNAGFGVGQGTVSVSIVDYDFHFVVPLVTRTIRMPPYKTTFVGESAGATPGASLCP